MAWSLEEEQAFLQGLKQFGADWAKIKQHFVPGRSRKQIYTHYRYFAQTFASNLLAKSGHGNGAAVRRVGQLGRPSKRPLSAEPERETMLRELEDLVLQLERGN